MSRPATEARPAGSPDASTTERAEQTEQTVRTAVETALQRIEDPCSVSMKAGWSVFDLGLLERVQVAGDEIVVEIVLTDPFCPYFDNLEEIIVTAVAAETGSDRVRVEVSGEAGWHPGRAKKGLLVSERGQAP
jgi:metal-sulfur cluster biosynthetic enzyme